MQWSHERRLNTIIAGRLSGTRYPRSPGRGMEHFVFLYTNTWLDFGEEGTCWSMDRLGSYLSISYF